MAMAIESCARCGARNDDGSAFCAGCGASLAAQIHCPSCNAMNPLGRAFCTSCGAALEHAGWGDAAAPGAVTDGVWERGGDELLRRVDPDEARRWLGARTVRVPAGSVGVVLVDGVVDRVLAPGERTSVSLFERVASFFAGRERTAFYLVDQRPFPVPFTVQTRPTAGGAAGAIVKTQVLVTFRLPKGERDALAQFIATVAGSRSSVATGDIYNLLRPEVARVAQAVIERAAAGAAQIDYPAAEVEIRRQLADAFARRYGLTVDVTLAPLTTVASANISLGTGAQRLFTGDGQEVELDLVVRAQGQHDDFTPATIAPALAPAAASYLRSVPFAALAAPGAPNARDALEIALAPVIAEILGGLGMMLVALVAVDVRSKTGEAMFAQRADAERRTVRLDDDRARAADRDAREALAAKGAALDRAQVDRDAELGRARDGAAQARRRQQVEAELAESRARRDADHAELARRERLVLELAAIAEQQQIEKLRAMAALDRELAAQEQAHVMARRAQLAGLAPEQMIAMQAGELATRDGGGAAWANAIASRADLERAHAADARGIYQQAMSAMAQVASSRAEAVSIVAPMAAVAPIASTAPVVAGAARSCSTCGAATKPGAKFCAECGAAAV